MPHWLQGHLYLLTSAETVDPHVRYVDTHQLVGSLLSFFKNRGWFCVSFFVRRSDRVVSDDERTVHIWRVCRHSFRWRILWLGSSTAVKEHNPFHQIIVLWPRLRGCETRGRSPQLDNWEKCVEKSAQGYRACCKESLGFPTSSFRQIARQMYAGIAKFPSGSSAPVALLACASSLTKGLCSWPVKHHQWVKFILFYPPNNSSPSVASKFKHCCSVSMSCDLIDYLGHSLMRVMKRQTAICISHRTR